MKRKNYFVQSVLPICLSTLALSCTRAKIANSENLLIGGQSSTGGQFPSTVFLKNNTCSGTFVSEWQIIYAGHCVIQEVEKPLVSAGSKLDIRSFDGLPFNNNQRRFSALVRAVHVHPSWYFGLVKHKNADLAADDLDVVDVAIIELDKIIPVQTAELNESTIDLSKNSLTLVGSGCEKEGEITKGNQKYASYGISKIFDTRILSKPFDLLTSLESTPCKGDSGGSGYLSDSKGKVLRSRNGKQILATVTSSRALPTAGSNSNLTDGILARIDTNKDWIKNKLKLGTIPTTTSKDSSPTTVENAIEDARGSFDPDFQLSQEKKLMFLFDFLPNVKALSKVEKNKLIKILLSEKDTTMDIPATVLIEKFLNK